MKFSKSFALAINSLVSNKMRSFLTMLGIIIGVSAVIILVSLMNGLTGQVTDIFEEMGSTSITISVSDRGGSRSVKPEEMYEFVEKHSDKIQSLSPVINVMSDIKLDDESFKSTAYGISEQAKDAKKFDLSVGRFISYVDIKNLKKVCVIGTYIEKKLFGMQSAYGKSIKINGYPYEVIGIIEETAESAQGSADEVIYIPYTDAIKMAKNSTVGQYVLCSTAEDNIDETVTLLKEFLNRKLGDSDYYMVMSMKDMLKQFNTITGTMSTVLICIAGISLLVGGIGIMNIMLVSVTERTREIGIRKSLGAKKRDIMSQFVIEAGTVSGIGGIIGILFGAAVAILAGKLLNLNVYPSIAAIAVAFFVSVGIGVGFGFLPANKAAKLNPIDALRYE